MSQGTPAPHPTPPNGISPTIAAIIAIITAIAAALGGKQYGDNNQPPKPPAPIIVVDDKTQPTPQPQPKPDDKTVPDNKPTPQPQPVPGGNPVASITVTDHNGNPVSAFVPGGQLLVVSAVGSVHGPEKTSLVWMIDNSVQKYVTDNGERMIINTPVNADVRIDQIVALGGKIATATVTIKCGNGPQPPPAPPGPGPIPNPAPDPKPAPKASKVTVAIVEDGLNRTPETAIFLNQLSSLDKLRAAGNDWRLYHRGPKEPSQEPAAIAAQQALQTAGYSMPGVVIYDKTSGSQVYAGKLPSSVAELTTIINGITGGTI